MVSKKSAHPVESARPDVFDSVSFVKADTPSGLAVPWPRRQDVSDCFHQPVADDLVVCVSHGWPYQVHPDPLGEKVPYITRLVEEAMSAHTPLGETVIFYDFLSVTQRPRVGNENTMFMQALKHMPWIYLHADAVLHVDAEWSAVPGDGEVVTVSAAALKGAELLKLGDVIQLSTVPSGDPAIMAHDILLSIDGCVAKDVDEARMAICAGKFARVRKSPMGKPNQIKAGERGWVFLERFCSMIKIAMVDEREAGRVAFSNQPAVLAEIREGGRKLREAAVAGEAELGRVLKDFQRVLERKKFLSTSTDAIERTEHAGAGTKPSWPSACCCSVASDPTPAVEVVNIHAASGVEHPDRTRTASERFAGALAADYHVVAGLMKDLAAHLPRHWEKEKRAQRHRQLVLAVNRGDAAACEELLASRADPNLPDNLGATCLHAAAYHADIPVCRVLLAAKADCGAQDLEGNTAFHKVGLWAKEETVTLFDLLVPHQVLCLQNRAGVSCFDRFFIWADTASNGEPFAPAQSRIDSLLEKYGGILNDVIATKSRKSTNPVLKLERQTQTHICGGKAAQVTIWEYPDADVDILLVYGRSLVPHTLVLKAIDKVAQQVCNEHQARILALYPGVLLDTFDVPLKQLQADLLSTIESLPLKFRFLFVDDSDGTAAALIWPLRQRLIGAMIINSPGFWPQDYLETPAHQGLAAACTRVVTQCKGEPEQAMSFAEKAVPANQIYGTRKQISELLPEYREAMESESKTLFKYSAVVTNSKIRETAETLYGLAPLELPATLLVGSFSPATMYQDAMQRLSLLFPKGTLTYITRSKCFWFMEGNDQIKVVANELSALLDRCFVWV